MNYRTCINGSLELSVLGIGCWSFGGGSYWGSQDQKDVNRVVHAALDHGINYFDTAEVYNEGRSEEALGQALKSVDRSKVVIGSKISPSNCYPDVLRRHCEASLNRLQTDYIDLYMIHWPLHSHAVRHFTTDQKIINNPPDLVEAWETLLDLKESGMIWHIGVSNFSTGRLKEIPDLEQLAANELAYNLVSRAIEMDVLDTCGQNGTGIIAYNALMQGYLTGNYLNIDDIPLTRRRTRHFDSRKNPQSRHGETGFEEELNSILAHLEKTSNELEIPMAELALSWIMANPSVTCTLAGARNLHQLNSNIKATEFQVSEEVKTGLDRISEALKEKMGNHFDYYEGALNDRTL